MKQRFDTSLDQVEELEETIFDEPTGPIRKRYRRLLIFSLVSISVLTGAYAITFYLLVHLIQIVWILSVIAIYVSSCFLAITGVMTEKWRKIFFYPLKFKAKPGQRDEEVHVPLKVDIAGIAMSLMDPSLSTSNDMLQFLEQSDEHVLILGSPGAGKSIALYAYQQHGLERRGLWHFGGWRLPVLISLRDYNAFLKSENVRAASVDDELPAISSPRTLRSYLYNHNESKSIRYLRPYLPQLINDGRVVLLIDGLNEIDSAYQEELCAELSELMQRSRVIMTCRELDYHTSIFETLASEPNTHIATIKPLERDQQDTFIQQYFQKEYTIKQGETWQNASDNVIRIIDTKKLRSECGNPFILLLLTRTLHSIGTTKEINTRGQLFREAISLLIRDKIPHEAFTEDDLLLYLGEIACTIRRMKSRNGLLLPDVPLKEDDPEYYLKAAIALKNFTDQPLVDRKVLHSSSYPVPTEFSLDRREEMLKFADKTPDLNLVFISRSEHILSFSHELMAEYFVAEYLHRICLKMSERDNTVVLPFGEELISTEGDWNEPIRIWAGLLDNTMILNPMSLADCLGKMGIDCQFDEDKNRMYNALTLGMLCLGVYWVPSSAQQQDPPPSLCDLLKKCISDEEKRAHLKAIFERCAQEGGDSVYRPLLKVLTFEGADELLLLLPRSPVSHLLFEYLSNIAGGAYENEVRSLVSILGRMGSFVVERAVELSKPSPMKSIRLRRAAIAILGYTRDTNVITPLLSYLDEVQEISDETTRAFQRLGSDIALRQLLQELLFVKGPSSRKRQDKILEILERFLSDDDVLNPIQYIECIKTLLLALPLSVQLKAKDLLLREARSNKTSAREVKEELILALGQSDLVEEILISVGHEATKQLLTHLKSSEATDMMRVRIVKILGEVRDHSALLDLHNHVAASSPLREAVAKALSHFPVENVAPELIDKVWDSNEDEANAACEVLVLFGRSGVELIIQRLFDQARPGRIALLVQTLQRLGDERAIPPLIDLMEQLRTQFASSQTVTLLAVDVVKALAYFKGTLVVNALLKILTTWPRSSQELYEQTIQGLSVQGEQALPVLLQALDVEKMEADTRGVLLAIVKMSPFPNEALLDALGYVSDAQVRYVMWIFIKRGKEEASFLVQQLCHKNTRIRSCIDRILERLDAGVIVEPLLERLSDDPYRSAVIQHLRRYPNAAIPRLVELLGDTQRGKIAVQVLMEFDVLVIERLRTLVVAFDNPKGIASQHAEQVFVALAKRHEELLSAIVGLFSTVTDNEHVYEALVHMLSTSLAYGSVSILISELASEHSSMNRGVIDTLVRLGRENDVYSEKVIGELIAALSTEKRPQAEKTLARIGERAISHIEPLAIDKKNLEVRQSARDILSKMGPLAFGVLFSFLSSHDSERRSAAERIIANMETKDIKDPLLQLLSDPNAQRIEQGLVLLLGRFRADSHVSPGRQSMLTVLLEHIQTHESDRTTVLILNFLLLLPERKQLLETFNQVLSRYPRTQQWFMPLFLLMNMEGNEARDNLFRLLQKESMTPLEKEFVGILGMLKSDEEVTKQVTKYATSIGDFAQSAGMPLRDSQVFQIERSRRAVGSLLISDYWNTKRLRELQNREPAGSVRHELFTVLLGESYVPDMLALREEINEKMTALQKAEGTIARLQNDIEKRGRQQKESNELIRRLHQENTDLGQQKDTLQQKNTELTQQVASLSLRVANLSQENANLKNRGIPPRPPFQSRF